MDLRIPTAEETRPGSVMTRWVVRGIDREMTFDGVLLGAATSRRTNHADHGECETYPCPGSRCSACRWFEVSIFKSCDGQYVVELTGQTIVPGERTRHRVEVTPSPSWVIDVLTQRDGDRTFIPHVSRRALAEASTRDPGIELVYCQRGVA